MNSMVLGFCSYIVKAELPYQPLFITISRRFSILFSLFTPSLLSQPLLTPTTSVDLHRQPITPPIPTWSEFDDLQNPIVDELIPASILSTHRQILYHLYLLRTTPICRSSINEASREGAVVAVSSCSIIEVHRSPEPPHGPMPSRHRGGLHEGVISLV